MIQYKINIGLAGNIYGKVIETLNNYRQHLILNYNITTAMGEYLGRPEQTAVITITSDKGYNHIHNVVKKLCIDLKQECIPLQLNGTGGELIYNENFTGKKYLFDSKYFIADHK